MARYARYLAEGGRHHPICTPQPDISRLVVLKTSTFPDLLLSISSLVHQEETHDECRGELPARLHRVLAAYAEALGREQGQPIADPLKLIVPMLERFIATDRGFASARKATGLSQSRRRSDIRLAVRIQADRAREASPAASSATSP